jgi:6-phosphofructokinase 1
MHPPKTHSVAEAISQKDFAKAMELRDPLFASAYDSYLEATLMTGPSVKLLPENERLRIGIIHTGAPAGGMNAATRVAARLCLNRGHVPLGIRNGFSGLLRDEVYPLKWQNLFGWQIKGGSELGTNRDHPKPLPNGPAISPKTGGDFLDLGQIAYHLQKHDIHALMVVGGFEAYTSILTLNHAREMYPAFCIPMVHLPATVSNNVPGTESTVGCDTALNAIVEACDRIKLSANASRNRVFVVEVQGGNCGYLASMGALITGAAKAYIPEIGININMLRSDLQHLVRRYKEEDRRGIPNEGRVVLRSENTGPSVYSTETISGILKAEGQGVFDSRTAVLGHLQQGGTPSPMDRIRATRLAVHCIDWIQRSGKESNISKTSEGVEIYTKRKDHACVVGVNGSEITFSSVQDLLPEADLKERRNKTAWWMEVNNYTRILAKYEYREEEDEGLRDDEL